MKYDKITEGVFIDRPNRFIAHVLIDGKEETCHVKNTGRCRELLPSGAKVYCALAQNPSRQTRYDLIAVEKGLHKNFIFDNAQKRPATLLINFDSQAPNAAVKEWLEARGLFSKITLLKPEYRYKDSRIDFYVECEKGRVLLEVKGVTLEEDGTVYFPDAPTKRGRKHVEELTQSIREGYTPYILFVVQMQRADHLEPNKRTDPDFAAALQKAEKAGVKILAFTCSVTPSSMKIASPLPVRL